jgi:pyruvate formate lyase activating enzyme
MKIVNYIQNSALETKPFGFGLVLFSYGCNLKCSFCKGYNYEQVTNPENVLGDAIKIIEQKITPLDDTVVFIGGEPTIWKGSLINSLKFCKEKGLKTKVFTNGMLPDTIKKINELSLCDAWSIDVKCLPEYAHDFIGCVGSYKQLIDESVNNCIQNNTYVEIRTTVCEENKNQLEDIKKWVSEYKYLGNNQVKHIIQKDFRNNLDEVNR